MTPKQAAAVASYARTGSLKESAQELGVSSVGTVAGRLEGAGVERHPKHYNRAYRPKPEDALTEAQREANRRRQAAYYRRHRTEPLSPSGGDRQSWDDRLFEPYAVRKARLKKERENAPDAR